MLNIVWMCDILVFENLRGLRLNFNLHNIMTVKVMLTTKVRFYC